MSTDAKLIELFERDRIVWDECAEQYEQSIVSGHPDIIAYEEFEEDLFDRFLLHLMRDKEQDVHLYDVGCGSARLHLHYGLKSINADSIEEDSCNTVKRLRKKNARHGYDPVFNLRMKRVGGLDFSAEMIGIAREKLKLAGLTEALKERLYLEVGSAFEMDPLEGPGIPMSVAVCNSIGVMQGPRGAKQLFKSMGDQVRDAGGIAIISCYRRAAVPTFALGNYESTMNVSGQPVWLKPDKYADPSFAKVPRRFKRAHDPHDHIYVNVFSQEGNLLESDFKLTRDPDLVKETCETGHIRMHSEYESRWYSTDQISDWIDEFWGAENSHHLMGKDLDSVRAEPVQLAIFDPEHRLDEIINRLSN
jgi:SAM-dependent methyltransferase